MAKFKLIATPASYEEANGGSFSSFSFVMTDHGKLGQRAVEAKQLSDLQMCQIAFGDEIARSYAGQFFVSALLEKGQRAPNGYRKNQSKMIAHYKRNQEEQAA